MQPNKTVKLLTMEETAVAIRCSTRTLARKIKLGLPVEYVGSNARFDLAAVRAWLKAQRKAVL